MDFTRPFKRMLASEPHRPATEWDSRPVYLGDHKLLVRTVWGGWVVVPSFNIDVAIGVARAGIIEAWTTRLVQEQVKPGHVVINAGANFGYYTVLSALQAGPSGKVFSIEANPHMIPYVGNSLFWSGVSGWVETYACAAWQRSGEELHFVFCPAFIGGGSALELWKQDHRTRPEAETIADALWDHRMVEIARQEDCRIVFGTGERYVRFTAPTRAIDDICRGVAEANLIHMDIEGGEFFALLGARKLVERSPNLTIIFEWSSHRYRAGSEDARRAFEEVWAWLTGLGFRVREIEPRLAADGGLKIGPPVTFEHLANEAPGSDFVAVRPHNDPWG